MLFTQHRCLVLDVMSISLLETAEPDPHRKAAAAAAAAAAAKPLQSCPTLSDPIDCSLPGSPIHGIFQKRVLEWGATAFSERKLSTEELMLLNYGVGEDS